MRALLIFILVVFVGGALLAPWLYWLAQWAGAKLPALASFAEAPFHRFVSRSMQLIALAGLWPFLRSLGARSWADLGLTPPRGHGRRIRAGFILGFATLAVVVPVSLACGARQLHGGLAGDWWGKLPAMALTAVVVALLEETVFRGALFGALRRAHGWKPALALSGAVYAIVHFFEPVRWAGAVSWHSGLDLLPRMMRGFVDLDRVAPGFLILALGGVLLALAYQRTGNLWFSIGLHAGWVFWLKSYNAITDAVPGVPKEFWGTGKLYDGWFALLLMAAAAPAVWALTRTESPAASERPQPCATFSDGAECPPGSR